jgi:SAM-dependent methyltransferase
MLGRARTPDVVAWHEVECGSYAADLPLWEELAAGGGGPILELGCGAGRVALHLGRLGYEVCGIDVDAALVETVTSRADAERLPVRARHDDATGFALDETFALALAPMQLVQIVGGAAKRRGLLASVAAHLRPGGVLAAPLVESHSLPEFEPDADRAGVPLPDVRELDGWIFSSLPLAVRDREGALAIQRLRQSVSPSGELAEEVDITELDPLSPAQLEVEAQAAGLRAAGRRQISETDAHVGSTVCLLEAAR